MKYCVILLILAALLGGCAVAPAAYGDGERAYNRGDGSYRNGDYNDANYHHYSYRGAFGENDARSFLAVSSQS
jgi:hypothetical protein